MFVRVLGSLVIRLVLLVIRAPSSLGFVRPFSLHNLLEFRSYRGLDSSLLGLLVLRVSVRVLGFALVYMARSVPLVYFGSLYLLFVVSMLFYTFSHSILLLLAGWDGLGLFSYFLVCFYYSASARLRGKITVLSNRVGDYFILMAMRCFLAAREGLLSRSSLRAK